jgi:uncharacterized protein involved in exopolysaccharide biosynthesis
MVSILGRATRFWPAASVVVLLATLAAIGFTFTRQRLYKSETLMLYREGIRSGDVGGLEGAGDPARKLALKLKEMVLSRTRLQQIIDENKLYPEIVADRGYVDAVDEMRNHIAFRVRDGDTFGLSFEGEDPARVQNATARLAETLIEENSKHRVEQAEATKDFIDTERKHGEEELREKEALLSKFLNKHPEFAKEGQSGSAALRAAQQKPKGSSNDPTLLALEREAARIQERLGMPVQRRPKDSPQSDPKLVAARNEAENDLHQAQRELADKLNQFTDQHPDVRAARTKVKAAEGKLKRAQESVVAADSALQQKSSDPNPDEGVIDRATLESQLSKVTEEIAAYKSKKKRESENDDKQTGASWIVALETEWSQLSRDVQEARMRVGQLNEKQFRASMVENATASGRNAQIEIVDPAYRPTHPSKPSRSTLLLVGLVLSIMLGMAAALTLALVDDRLYDRIDVDHLELAPLLGVVPRAPSEGSRSDG